MASTTFARLLLRSTFCIAGILGLGVTAASAQVHSRIAAPTSDNSSVAIAHSVHPRVRSGSDLGPAAQDMVLRGMSIHFNMTPAQEAALDQLLADQQNPRSPRFQQWLTPTQYAAQFGMSPADLTRVSAWLTNHGFTVTGVANGGSFITFDGKVAQVQRAFATSIHKLSVNGETHFANISDVSLPTGFAGAVAAVTGLHDFRPKPLSTVSPRLTSSVSGGHFMTPGDLYTIYNMNPLLNSGIKGSGIGTGANCHSVGFPSGSAAPPCADIAVIGRVDINLADVSAFRSASGLNTTNLPTTVFAGSDPGPPKTCSGCLPNAGDLAESSLDVEWAGAMAPSATIDFVTGVGVFSSALTYAIQTNLAPIITVSYGNCEAGSGSGEMTSVNALFKQANAQGQTIVSATGDQGATDCDDGPSATGGLAVDFPGSSPYVTGVGGTQFNGDPAATGTGSTWSATPYWAGTNGSDIVASALSYIPETVWNDETSAIYGGGGGGASAFFSKPAWQTGTGVPADGSRDEPDLALTGSNIHDSLLSCVSSSCVVGFRASAGGNFNAGGGTSYDSQIFGGMLALIEQKIGHRIGNANPTIYALANNPSYYAANATITSSPFVVFNDVTTGNNSQPCSAGTPNCGNGSAMIGYSAGPGYDLATGWGSVNVSNLANAWSLVTPTCSGTTNSCSGSSVGATSSSTSLNTSSTSVPAGTSVILTATITGSAGIPTGTVQFLVNGVVVGSSTLNASGIATYTYTTSCANLAELVLPKFMPSSGTPAYAGVHSDGQTGQPSTQHGLWKEIGSGVSLACLLLFALPGRRRFSGLLAIAFAAVLVGGMSGCGSSQTAPPPSTSTPAARTGLLTVAASYSGNGTYAGSIASGIQLIGANSATPIEVVVTAGSCN